MLHITYMRRCFELAQLAKGYTAPNPMVGAILVHEGRIIGQGYHHHYGSDHAEVDCLKNVAEADKNLIPRSAMYVSLEPCAHYGLTPPCAIRLVQERIREVYIANTDPFEKVHGNGISILRLGGIPIMTGMLEKEGAWINRRFFCFHTQKRPYIILKWAQTSDHFMAPADRTPHQITGPESQQLVHKWRTEEGAIMVGATTAKNDDPRLTARLSEGKQPLRIALDRNLQLPPTHNLLDDAAPTWLINELEDNVTGNFRSIKLPFNALLLPGILDQLWQAKILSVIIEGGAALLQSFIEQGLWDEARIFTGPATLQNGIPSPALTDATHAFSDLIGADQLNIFVNKNSPYPYVSGMAL
jgi:diaminohydroxyphosphoribosylaminopyrimidine deaminase/5-amino-6-(5-phosphoribosylamino)uracil reductase